MEEDSTGRPEAGAAMEAPNADWRAKRPPGARKKVIDKILDTLKAHLTISGPEDLTELRKIAIRYEEKIYRVASSQDDYVRRITLKLLTVEKSQHAALVDSLMSNSTVANQSPAEPASLAIQQPQESNQGQSSIPVVNQPSALQQLSLQSIETSSLQNMPGTSQNSARNFVGTSPKHNIYANAQRVMQERQQQQQQSKNQFLHQHQLQQKLLKQKSQRPSPLQQHSQQQQQSLLQTTHLQSYKQPLIQMSSSLKSDQSTFKQTQSSAMQSAAQSGFQLNQLSSVQQAVPSLLQQHPPTVARQQLQVQPIMHQQMPSPQQLPASVPQLSSLALQPNLQQLMGSQGVSNFQQGQILGQQLDVTDMQQQLQMAPVQGNNLLSMQQPQPMMNQNNISLHHHPQVGPHSDISGQQQQQQLSSMASLQPHGQQPQHQSLQQPLMSQSLLASPLQHLAMQQNPNFMQQEMQQLQDSGALLSGKRQKQFVQSQRGLPNASSSTSLNSTSQTGNEGIVDWQEEVYQKIKSLKELYFAELNELYQKILRKLQQHDACTLPGNQSEQYEKLKIYKFRLQHSLTILQISKSNIYPYLKDNLHLLEKQIVNFVASNKRKVVTSQPPRQQQCLPSGGQAQSMPHRQPSQVPWSQQHDDPANQVQQMNLQDSENSVQSAAVPSMQHGSMPLSMPFVPMTQQNIKNASQTGSPVDQVEGSFSSLQKEAIISKPQGGVVSGQNTMNSLQQTNANILNSAMNTLQDNCSSMQPSPNGPQMQQQQQQQEQQQPCVAQSQQISKQLQQYHMQQQLIQRQQMQRLQPLERQLQQQNHQQALQTLVHQMPQFHQTNEAIELKGAQGSGMKSGFYQQHSFASQCHSYYQQLKSAPEFSVSSPQHLKALSQISQYSSQIDQHFLLSSQLKAGSPLQSPSTTLCPSPLPGNSDKPLPGTSSLPNAGHIGYHQTDLSPPQVQSLAVVTPGISASTLLSEFTSSDRNQANLSTEVAGKTNAVEQPLERLIKVVQSSPPEVLSSAVSDIVSAVSMIDSITGSAPGNGSRAAVGEDLVAMTKCVEARNFMMQDRRKKMKHDTRAITLSNVLSAGSVSDMSYGLHTSELKSTATSCAKRQKVEVNHALLEEIGEINQQLIDTVVNICEEDADSIATASEVKGTVIKCSFRAVDLRSSLKSQVASALMSPILPLRLLVPANYPKSSPVPLDKLQDKLSSESDDLSAKTKSRFGMSIRGLSEPMSLGEMARTWDDCARKVITEYAQQNGGGSFSSQHGVWEHCVGA